MQFSHPSWSYDTNIYEVNVRQYTNEGTFNAFREHLPRLRDMGVEILWFMPITSISIKDRKGSLGSYYAVENYIAVNPEFGSLSDFAGVVEEAHQLGFKVIIDWVANHTGNDNNWINEHPEFFCYDDNGIIHPHGWEDVSKLNFDNEAMQQEMIRAMRFWIDSCKIDGFRCDMAHLVPLDFWKKAKAELSHTKSDLFWLGECEEIDYHEVFDATYTWKWMHRTEEFSRNQVSLKNLLEVLEEYDHTFPSHAFRVYFTSNHDENSWNGTEYEKYNGAVLPLAVFSCTWKGIPMLYSGQELPNHKRLMFFDKDVIDWQPRNELHEFYRTLLWLRKNNSALRAEDAVNTSILKTWEEYKIFSYLRINGDDVVLVILNFSPDETNPEIFHESLTGKFKNIFDNIGLNIEQHLVTKIKPWGFQVFVKEKAS